MTLGITVKNAEKRANAIVKIKLAFLSAKNIQSIIVLRLN